MRKPLILSFLFLATMALASTTVTGNLKNGGATVASGTKVRFTLEGCGANTPRIIGTQVIVANPPDVAVNTSTGAFSQSLLANNRIDCGGSTAGTVWRVTYLINGTPVQPTNIYRFLDGNSYDLSSATPITVNPVVPAPTGDGTYLRLDGGNGPVTGPLTWSSLQTFNGGIAGTGNLGAFTAGSGILGTPNAWSALQSFKKTNGTFYADQYAGADASIKINACLADVLAAGGGVCDASGLGGVQTISQEIDVSARSIGAGQWVVLLLPAYGTWGSTMSNPTGCVIKQFDHSSIIGRSSGQGQQMVISANLGANVADVYCTDDAPTNGGSYIRAEGFSVRAFSGATIGRAVAEFRKLFDNSDVRSFTAVNGVAGAKAVWFWQVSYDTVFFAVSGEGGSAGIPCTIGNTNGAEASAATQGANFWLSCVHPGDGFNALVIAEGSTWTYANNIWNVYGEGIYPTDTTTAAIAVTNSGGASGANTIWNARLGSDNVGATRYLIDIAASAKLIVHTMSNSNANYINHHTGSGIVIAGSPNGTLSGYSTDTGYEKSTVIFTGDSNAQFFDFGQGAGANPSASANVVAASQPRFEIKSTATSGGSSRSYLDFLDGNNDGYEQTFTADGANNPLEWYPITGLTRGSKMLSLDNTGLLGIVTAKIGSGGTVTSSGAGGTMAAAIASGTATMTTALIGAGACGSTVTVAASGVATTDAISFAYNASVAANPGVLIINRWPTANNVNFNYCNPTAAGVTPSAATLNWSVTR